MTCSKIAIIYLNYGPYHIARINALAKLIPNVYAIEIASKQGIYPWQRVKADSSVNFQTFFNDIECESVSTFKQGKAVKKALDQIKPSIVIVAGYSQPVMRAATQWANKHNIPTILLFVSTYFDHSRSWWKELLKSNLLKNYTSIAVTGSRAKDYALRLKALEERIFQIGNVVDNHYFQKSSEKIKHENLSDLLKQNKLPENYFLCVSRLSPEKNLKRLLLAFKSYREKSGQWSLVIVGSGPQKQELMQIVKEHAIDAVRIVNWQHYEKLPLYYTLAKCLVLPSLSEPWGLVVNEAMACGLPVLVSNKCGCQPELCKDGSNGYSFDPEDITDLAKKMQILADNSEELGLKGRLSQKIIANFTPQTWAQGLYSCIKNTLI